MELIKKINFMLLVLCLPNLVWGHDGLHAAGQVNVGSYHMGMLEVSLVVVVFIVSFIWFKKKAK